ncbi:DUF7544 domain-containing protein [Methanogenium organophilum]|uniref:Transmembrane protein n=1 Tax=Methanogenium organophilum TaxID=2199 RepID=A0A9X9S2J8_METOG|nr:hypothetical protein [Methanogenium organophilum]WAI00674.1 hypothetical protein OU421_09595 [Methanogenium organophilum]
MTQDHYAFREIDRAIAKTRSILIPFDAGIWLRLALIALFAGGAAGGVQFSTGTLSPEDLGDGTYLSSLIPQNTDALISALLIIGGILLGVGLIYLFLNGIFQFIFIKALGADNIRIRTYFRESTGPGIRYFAFLFISSTFFFGLSLGLAYLLLAPLAGTTALGAVFARRVLTFAMLMLILLIPYLIILMLTTDFVVPIMNVDQCGILSGWKQCLYLFSREKTEAVLYTVMKLVLSVCVSIILSLVLVIVGIGAGIPLMGILMAAGGPQNISLTSLALLFAIYFAVVTFCGLMASVPFVTFLRTYSLYVIGDFDHRYSLLQDTSSPDKGEVMKEA